MITQTNIELGGFSCTDPTSLRDEAIRNGLPYNHWYGLPNSFYSARGKNPGYAYILLDKKSLDNLVLTGPVDLKFFFDGKLTTIRDLRFIRATALYADSFSPSDSTIYLILLADVRAGLHFSAINKQYNVQCPTKVDSDETYYGESLNSNVAWTWQELLDDIWTGSLPSGKDAPQLNGDWSWAEDPEHFRFLGVSAWDAYNTVLNSILHMIWFNPLTESDSEDPTSTSGEFKLIDLTEEDPGWTATLTPLEGILEYNAPYDVTKIFLPETLKVYFPIWEKAYGSEKDAFTSASNNWAFNALEEKEETLEGLNTVEETFFAIHDNHPAKRKFDGTLDNELELEARAAELAVNMTARIQRMNGLYHVRPGIHTNILPDSEVAAIRWADTGDDFGMTTELFGEHATLIDSIHTRTCEGPAQTILLDDVPRSLKHVLHFAETVIGPDLARKTYPIYPRPLQLVRNIDMNIASEDDWAMEGKIVRMDPETGDYSDGDSCWLRPIDNPQVAFTEALTKSFRFFGKQVGQKAGSIANDWPVYVIPLRPC